MGFRYKVELCVSSLNILYHLKHKDGIFTPALHSSIEKHTQSVPFQIFLSGISAESFPNSCPSPILTSLYYCSKEREREATEKHSALIMKARKKRPDRFDWPTHTPHTTHLPLLFSTLH